MSELFSQYPKDRFISNLKNLKQSIGKAKSAVAFDQTAFLHDRQLFPKAEMSVRGCKRWDGSSAQQLLKQDIKNNKHLYPVKLKPQSFQKTRPEYQEFPHLSRTICSGWLILLDGKESRKEEEKDRCKESCKKDCPKDKAAEVDVRNRL
jgi:hypothetical protein